MSKISRRKRIVTQRDEKLFHYLYLNKVASIEQIRRDIFENAGRQVVYRRLTKLLDSYYLETTYLREKGNRVTYSLTSRTVKEYIGDRKEMKRHQRKSQSIPHDLALVNIRNRFQSFSMVRSYLTENALQSGIFDDNSKVNAISEVNPDAIVELSLSSETIFLLLEFERAPKFNSRYDTLISRYYRNKDAQAVLFISDSYSIQKRVMQAESRVAKTLSPKLFYLTLDELLSNKGKSNFKNIKQEVLTMT